MGSIRVGIGGWSYAPWRGVFYPKGLKQADELAYATAHLDLDRDQRHALPSAKPKELPQLGGDRAGRFRLLRQRPAARSHGEGPGRDRRLHRSLLKSGLVELGDKLGPLVWQFAPFKRFDEVDFGSFLDLLPREFEGRKLNHVVEVRHHSFNVPRFAELLRVSGVTAAYVDAKSWPNIADLTGDVVYARLQRGDDALPAAYPPRELDAWAGRARIWAQGGAPDDLPRLDATHQSEVKPRDVFIYFIHEGKLRAPAAAMALIEGLASTAN